MKKILIYAAIGLIMASCASSDLEMPNEPDKNLFKSSNVVTLNEALNKADSFFNTLEKSKTRSNPRTVKNILTIGHDGKTRSNNYHNGLFYLVNYSDEQGFALLAADKRLTPVYAISNEGNLNLSDTVFNGGLAMFFQDAISEANSIIYSDGFDPDPGILPPPTIEFDTIVNTPMLDAKVAKWSQNSPYNYFCDPILIPGSGNWVKPPVGCTALACAMIMSYYKWPDHYGNLDLDWDQMISLGSRQDNYSLFYILRRLGDSENLHISYGLNGSGSALLSRHNSTFENFGYQGNASFNNFGGAGVNSVVSITNTNRHPVLVGGDNTSSTSKHAWVIDGSIVIDAPLGESTLENPTGILTYYYFHNVWGWGGSGNGYYKYINGSLGGTADFPDAYNYTVSTYDNLLYRSSFIPNLNY